MIRNLHRILEEEGNIKITDVIVNWTEHDADSPEWMKKEGESYSLETIQKLINEEDYKYWNSPNAIGYLKVGLTVNLIEDEKPESIDIRIDLGDGKYGAEEVSIKHIIEKMSEDGKKVENPDIKYDIESYKQKYGDLDSNIDKFIAEYKVRIPDIPDYRVKTPEEIKVGDIYCESVDSYYHSDDILYKFYKVTRVTKASAWVEPIKSDSVTAYKKGVQDGRPKLQEIKISYPTDIKDDRKSIGMDLTKPFRIKKIYNDELSLVQGDTYLQPYIGSKAFNRDYLESYIKPNRRNQMSSIQRLNETLSKILEEDQSIENDYTSNWEKYTNGTNGDFNQALSNAFEHADSENLKKLYNAFPEVGKIFALWQSSGKTDDIDELLKGIK